MEVGIVSIMFVFWGESIVRIKRKRFSRLRDASTNSSWGPQKRGLVKRKEERRQKVKGFEMDGDTKNPLLW